MQIFHDLANFPVFRYALVTGLAVGVVCSLLSVIVVLKRMAFIGQGISHAGFGGVGTAILLGLAAGWAQDLLVLAFCVGTGVLIGVLSRRKRLEADSAIGILLVAAMAWGVLVTDLSVVLQRYDWYRAWFGIDTVRPGFEQLLFGSLLSVTKADMWLALATAAVVVLTLAALAKELLFFTFDETVSRVYGVRTGVLYYLLLVLLSLTIVVAIRLVGFVLVSALLVIPGATALQLSRRLGRVLAASVTVGLVGVLGGLWLSLAAGELSSGPCIVGVLCGLFGVVFASRALTSGLNRSAGRA